MRILILGSKEYPLGTSNDMLPSGGMEVYLENFIMHLSKRSGIESIVITRYFKGTERYERKNGIEIYRVSWLPGFLFRNISFNLIAFLRALCLNFDVICANGPVATFFGIVLSRLKKRPILALPHGLALEQPQYNAAIRWAFALLEKVAYSSAHCIVFLSDGEKDEFRRKLGFLPKSYKIILPGMDREKHEKALPQKIKEEFNLKDELVITFVGRLIRVKGIEYLIEGIARIKAHNFKVLIVGNGAERHALEKKVFEAGLKEKIIFAGQRSDVAEILAASSIFVLPSISEGLPMALLEAMASSLPCVVTEIGLPVKHEETALVVPPRDAEALADAIERLIRDKELREKLGKNAKEEVLKKYSWERAAEEYMKTFEELLKCRR